MGACLSSKADVKANAVIPLSSKASISKKEQVNNH